MHKLKIKKTSKQLKLKIPYGENSIRWLLLYGELSYDENFLRRNSPTAKFPYGELSSRRNFLRRNLLGRSFLRQNFLRRNILVPIECTPTVDVNRPCCSWPLSPYVPSYGDNAFRNCVIKVNTHAETLHWVEKMLRSSTQDSIRRCMSMRTRVWHSFAASKEHFQSNMLNYLIIYLR